MAKTTYVSIPPELIDLYRKGLKPDDRFTIPRMRRNDTLLTRQRIKGLTAKSLLPQIAILWHAFSDAERLAWQTASDETNMNGWQLFVQDQTIRIKNKLAGSATPKITHQSWIGQIKLGGTAKQIKLAQYHPHNYYIRKKVYGIKGLYYPLMITEDFALPLDLQISYKSNLTIAGVNPYAKFYASVWHSYQGRDLNTEVPISFDFSKDWETLTASLSTVIGYIVSYTLYIEINDLQGSLFFDNVKVVHSSQNWARDPYCKNIDQQFTKQYYQVPKHWAGEILPVGAEFDSVYIN